MAIGETKKEVRTTWIGFTVIFAVIGSILFWRERSAYPYFYAASAFFGIFAAVAPMTLLPLYRLWVKFAMALAWFNTHLLLGIVFYFVMTPIGLFMRLLGKDPMTRKIDPKAKSYWIEKKPREDANHYEKQF